MQEINLEPMSTFKWNRLEDVAVRLGVAGYVASGVRCYSGIDSLGVQNNAGSVDDEQSEDANKRVPLPPHFMEKHEEEPYSSADAHFCGIFKQRCYERICDEEMRDKEGSLETLRLLQLIVSISHDVVVSSLPLHGIITLGRFLRNDGDKVDYVKLESWIKRLGIVMQAALQAGMLIEVFGFEKEEFPYVRRLYTNSRKHYYHLLHNAIDNRTSFSNVSRMNIALSETISHHLSIFTDKVTNIEE